MKKINIIPHVAMGKSSQLKGMFDEAIRELKESIKNNPNMAMTHKNLEFAYRKKGMEEEANNELKLYEELSKKTK